jgi:peptidoglycan/LPS O-acetylase OafA/YrhL
MIAGHCSLTDRAAPARLQYVALDSLRGVCALMVVLYHLHPDGMIASLPIARNGWMFVDFFFVLSGFVISASYGARLAAGFSLGKFLWLRLGRLYPLHIFVMLLLVATELLAASGGGQADGRPAFTGPFSFGHFLLDAALLQSFGLSDVQGWNIASWSIAAEFWTYLLFALVVRASPKNHVPVFAGLFLVALVLLFRGSENWLDTSNRMGFVRCVLGFSLGVLVKAAFDRLRFGGGGNAELITLAAVITYVSLVPPGPLTFLAPPLFAVMVFIFAREAGAVSRLLHLPVFRLLGQLSYSIYMIHLFALARYFEITGPLGQRLPADLITLGALAFVCLIAWGSWRLIEMPTRAWSRKMVSAMAV